MFARLRLPALMRYFAQWTFVVVVPATPAAEPKPLELPFRLNVGDEIHFQRVTKRTSVTSGDVREGVGTRDFDLRVLEAGPKGYVISCKYGKPKIEGGIYEDSPVSVHFNHLMARFDLQLALDANGQVTDIKNWNQITGGLNKAMDDIEAEFKAANAPGPLAAVDRASLSAMFDDKDSIQANSARDFEILSFPFNKKYLPDRSTEFAAEKDGVVFRDVYSMRPTAKPNLVELNWTHSFDRDATKELLKKRSQESGDDPNRPFPSIEYYDAYKDERATIYLIDAETSRILQLTSKHITQTGDNMSIYEVAYRIRPSM